MCVCVWVCVSVGVYVGGWVGGWVPDCSVDVHISHPARMDMKRLSLCLGVVCCRVPSPARPCVVSGACMCVCVCACVCVCVCDCMCRSHQSFHLRSSGRVALLNPPLFWDFGAFLQPPTMLHLYPTLCDEILTADIWLRLYARADDLSHMEPPPSVVIAAVLSELDMIRNDTHSFVAST